MARNLATGTFLPQAILFSLMFLNPVFEPITAQAQAILLCDLGLDYNNMGRLTTCKNCSVNKILGIFILDRASIFGLTARIYAYFCQITAQMDPNGFLWLKQCNSLENTLTLF